MSFINTWSLHSCRAIVDVPISVFVRALTGLLVHVCLKADVHFLTLKMAVEKTISPQHALSGCSGAFDHIA